MRIKLPFNWAGNKLRYMDYVNTLILGKEYNRVVDMFLGSGHLLLNIQCKANEFIGNDIIRLIPEILEYLSKNKEEFTYKDIKQIEDTWKFIASDQYYLFRDYWNEKYKNNKIDKEFVIETVMLLKMCNNSLARFNRKGEFNQGFRGLAKTKSCPGGIGKFFTESSLKTIPTELNTLNNILLHRNFKFYNKDFRDIITETLSTKYDTTLGYTYNTNKDLIILDPPYILSNTATYGGTYDDIQEDYLLNYLDKLNREGNDFILFNFLNNCGENHTKLQDAITTNNYRLISLSKKGKLKSIEGGNKVHEVIVTNIKD